MCILYIYIYNCYINVFSECLSELQICNKNCRRERRKERKRSKASKRFGMFWDRVSLWRMEAVGCSHLKALGALDGSQLQMAEAPIHNAPRNHLTSWHSVSLGGWLTLLTADICGLGVPAAEG